MVTQGSDTLMDAVVTGVTGSRHFDHQFCCLTIWLCCTSVALWLKKKQAINKSSSRDQ